LGHRTNIQCYAQIKDSRTLAAAALIRRTAGGRRSFQAAAASPELLDRPVAHIHGARQVAHPCGGRPRGGRPGAVGAIVRREGLLVSAVGLAASARRGRLRRAKPAKRGPKPPNQPAGGGTCAFAAGEPPAEQRLERAETIIELKKPSRNAAACGIETVVLYPGCEGAAVLLWRVTRKKHGPWVVANLRVVTSSGDPFRKLINCATQPFRFCKQEDRMKRKANRRQLTPGLRWSIQTQQPSISVQPCTWRRWALTAHPTRFAVLGLSLLICTGWLIGLRMRGQDHRHGIDQRLLDPDF